MTEQHLISDKNSLLNYPVKPTISVIKVVNGIIKKELVKDLLNIGTVWFYFWGDFAVESENLADSIAENLRRFDITTISNLSNNITDVKKDIFNLQLDIRHLFIDD
ncbi:hypothetical protein HDR59_01225 [bacterium]|nr:hypothetical protein [bacterium]